jgi:hypothetical protein
MNKTKTIRKIEFNYIVILQNLHFGMINIHIQLLKMLIN